MCRTAFGHNNISRHTTHGDSVWIEQLTVMFATCTKVKLEDSVTVEYLTDDHFGI